MAVPNSLTDPLAGTSLLENAPPSGSTLSDQDRANIESAGPDGLVNLDKPVPEYRYTPGDKPTAWSVLAEAPAIAGASTDDKLRAFDNHSRRVALWMESQPDYNPSMRAEVTAKIRAKRAEIESGRTLGERAGRLGQGLIDSMVASVGGGAMAVASQFTGESREPFYEMLGASTDKAIDYVTKQHIDREVPAAQSERYAELVREGFTEKTGGGKWIGKYIDRREKLDGAVESFKSDLDNGNFPGDPEGFKRWIEERQNAILSEAKRFNEDEEDYLANPSRKFSTDLDLVNSLSHYTATRNDASFDSMIQQMVRSSDREKADNQWEKAFSEGGGVTGGIREAERAQTGTDDVSRLVAQGGTDPTELASTAISAILTGGTAKAVSTVAKAGSRAEKVGKVAANTATDVAVEAGTEAFQSQVENPNSSPWEAAADGALLALAFQITGAALGATGRVARSAIAEDSASQSGSLSDSPENERQAGLPRTDGRQSGGLVTSVLDEIAEEDAANTTPEAGDAEISPEAIPPMEQPPADGDANADEEPALGESPEPPSVEDLISRLENLEAVRAQHGGGPNTRAELDGEIDALREEIARRTGDEEVNTPDAPMVDDPSRTSPDLPDVAESPDLQQSSPQPKGIGDATESEVAAEGQPSAATTEPTVARSFDLGDDLRADLVQNPDGTVSVRKTNTETGATIPLRGAEQPFPDMPSALRFVADTFSLREDADAAPSQVSPESAPVVEERGETDPLMMLLAREKMQPVQADIGQIGRVSRRERSGFRGMDRDTASRGDYHGAPLIRDYQGNPSAQARLRAVYDRNSSNRPDQIAQMAYDELGPNVIAEPTAEALFEAIKRRLDGDAGRVSQDRTSDAEIAAIEQARGLEMEASYEGFMRAISSPWRKGGEVRAGDLQVGDRLTVGDAAMEVTDADADGITVRSSEHGTHMLPAEERIGYDTLEENGIPATEREGTSPENVVPREETATLTRKVRDALAEKGIQWGGRALTSREHSAMVRSRAHLEAARRLAQLFGRRVVGVTGDFPANGAVVPGDVDNIYLRVDSSRSELLVASHEMLHILKRSDQELYSELLATMDADLTAYIEQVRPEHADGTLDMDAIKEEFLADYLAERSGDIRFWESLAARDPSLFERFANFVTAFLREIRELIAADRIKVESYLRNQAEMRDAIEGVMVAFRARQELGERGLLDGFDESMPFSDWDAQRSVHDISDGSFFSAVDRGDMASADFIVGKVADIAGFNPKSIAFHGSPIKGFSVFDPSKLGDQTKARDANLGFFFAHQSEGAAPDEARRYAENFAYKSGELVGEVRRFYLRNPNPYYYDHGGQNWRPEEFLNAVKKAKDDGYSGVIIANVKSPFTEGIHHEEVVFDPSQIKLADTIVRDDQGNIIPPSKRFDINTDDIRFSDRTTPRLYQPNPPVTKPNQQVAGRPEGRPDEVETWEEWRTTVRNHYFDGTVEVAPHSIADAYAVIADMEAGTFDASQETGLDGANSTLVAEIYNFAGRVLAETGDDAMLQRVKNRANDYFNRGRTVSGRSLNAARQYATPLDNALSEIEDGKKAAVDQIALSEDGQVVKLSAELEKLNRELDAMRLQLADFTEREMASIVSAVEGKRSQGGGTDRAAKILTGGKKGGRRIAALAEELESFLSAAASDILFADREISADERNFAIRRMLEDQVRSGKRKRSVFVRNLMQLGMTEEQANNRYDKAMEFRERARTALAEDIAERKSGEPEKTAGELLVEKLDAESKRLDRLNRMVDRIVEKLTGARKPRRSAEKKRSELEEFVAEQTELGDGFDREVAIKEALQLGFASESAAKLADAIHAGIKNAASKPARGRGARRKDISERAREIAERFDNPTDRPARREGDPLRELVLDTIRRGSAVSESAFMDRARRMGVSDADAANLWRSLSDERAKREEIRDLKRRADEAAQPGDEARRIIRRLAESQSDTQDNRPRPPRESAVNAIYRDYVSHGGYGERPGPALSRPGFVSALMQEGVPQADAEMLATVADRERRNRADANKGRGAANAVERSVPFIMREILAHPELRLVGPEERLRMMASVFEDRAGMAPVDARAAAQLMESHLVRKWDEAARRLAEEWATKRNAPGFRREPGTSGRSGTRKTVFETIQEAIRAGAYDPKKRVLDEVAKANGWTDLTESELRRLAELDARLSAGVSSEGLTWFEDMRIKRQIARLINQSNLPSSAKKLIREYYLANIFSGIRTWMLQHSVLFNTLANMGLRDPLVAAFGSATGSQRANLTGYVNAMLGISRHVKNGFADMGLGLLSGEVRGAIEKEIVESSSTLEQTFDRAMSVWNNPRSTVAQRTWAATKILLSASRFSFRVLSAFDGLYQGVIRTYTNELELFSKAAGLGLDHGTLRAMTGEVMNLTEQFKEEAEAKGFASIADRTAYVNDRVTLALYDAFEGHGVPRTFIDESRARAFREAAIETGVNEFESGTLGSTGAAKAVQEYVRKGDGLVGRLMQFLVAVVRTPHNVFHRSAWWSPYGLVRLAHVGVKTKGFRVWQDEHGNGLSPYEQSLADPAQLMRRTAETALGTAATGALAGLLVGESDKDDDEKLFRINLSGPSRSQSAEFTAWRMTGRRPFTIQFRPGKNSDWSTVGFRRGGMEFINFAATILGAWDNRQYSRLARLSDDEMGKFAGSLLEEMTGETFFFMRPFTSRYSLGSKEAMGSQLGFMASGFVPFSSMLRTPNRFRDYQDYEGGFGTAFLMQMPVVPLLREDMPALNSLGDPLGANERHMSYIGAQFGIPLGYVPFRPRAKDGEPVQEEDIYRLLGAKGYFPPVKSRADFKEDISLTTYRDFVRRRGERIDKYVIANYARLGGMEPERFKEVMRRESAAATRRTQSEMRLQ